MQGYPYYLPKNGLDKIPTFQGNNLINVKSHLKAFTNFLVTHANRPSYNHEDVKMNLFVISLEEDALDWFLDNPNNSFDFFQDIINYFKDKYGDKR